MRLSTLCAALLASSLCLSTVAPVQAGPLRTVKKVVKGAALITAGVVIYEVIQKLKASDTTKAVLENPASIPEILDDAPQKVIEKVIREVERIRDSHDTPPDLGNQCTLVLDIIRER